MSKIIKNTTLSSIEVKEVGVTIPASSQYIVDPGNYRLWATAIINSITGATQFVTNINSGDLVVNDGYEDLTDTHGKDFLKAFEHAWNIRFDAEPKRANGFYLDDSNVQEAIEFSKTGAIDNDLDKMQFGKQGISSNNTYLLTLNNLSSYYSPDVLGYNIYLRRVTVSVSNTLASGDDFTIRIYKCDYYHNNRQPIFEYKFGVDEGNFSGHSGNTSYTLDELDIPVDKDWGMYAQNYRYTGQKPADINLICWTRKR